MVVIYKGIESIRLLLDIKAPLLITLGLVLLAWAYQQAGGFGPILSQPSAFDEGQKQAGQFWGYFFPALTGMVGFWATLSLNIPDFSRYAKTQEDQALGQAIGLPATVMAPRSWTRSRVWTWTRPLRRVRRFAVSRRCARCTGARSPAMSPACPTRRSLRRPDRPGGRSAGT